MREILHQLIVDSLNTEIPALTRRDARLPEIENKAHAVIGMRRSGKTTFLWQCLADRREAGTPREALLYLNFEDERLTGLKAEDLQWIVEDYFRILPQWRDRRTVTFFLDEIQLVDGWERFVRRIMDTERVGVFLSGSSARLLSREVATSMRGRALETVIHPFSFREVLRHEGMEPSQGWKRLPKAVRSTIDARLRRYLEEGGFPESIGAKNSDRRLLLRNYVDVAVLRDVIERHKVSNPAALRWLQRQLLSNPAGAFSIQKHYETLRSEGLPVSKDSLHSYLAYLEDAFLLRHISLHSTSERRRMVNPRKAYPVDPGLITIYTRSTAPETGQALETVVMLELERRGYEVGYLRTDEGYEIDFFARSVTGLQLLIQVTATATQSDTRDLDIRALLAAASEYPEAEALLLTLDSIPPKPALPEPLRWQSVAEWLLEFSFTEG